MPAWGGPITLPAEPALETQKNWELKSNGLLYISYDLNKSGKPDFFTLRRVLKSYRTHQSLKTVAASFVGKRIFFVNYPSARHIYITSKKPLFYAIDQDEDGHWDLIFKDSFEDGVNGNELFYDSPSGLYSASLFDK